MRDLNELDLALDFWHFSCSRLVHDRGLFIEDIEDTSPPATAFWMLVHKTAICWIGWLKRRQ